MDRELLAIMAILVAAAMVVALLKWDQQLPGSLVRVLRFLGLAFGLVVGGGGLMGLAATVTSGPAAGTSGQGEIDLLPWIVPLMLISASALYLWGVERRGVSTSAWIRRAGWVIAVLGLSLTSLSDPALILAIAAIPTLLAYPSVGNTANRDASVTNLPA